MKITKTTWDLFIEEHVKNKLSVKAICLKYNMKYTTVYYGLIRHGVTIDTTLTDRRRFEVDDNYFSTIDSHIKAYILGLLLCDGSAQVRETKTNRVYIKLKESDKYLLEQVRDEIAPDYQLTKGSSDKGGKIHYSYRLEIASNKLVEDLNSLGMVQDKFLRTLPSITEEFKGSLVRGMFDADGSISKTKRQGAANSHQVYIAGTNQRLVKQLHTYLGLGSLYLDKRESLGEKDMLYLRFNKVEDKLTLFNLMYSNTSILLKRKFSIYTNYANTVLSTSLTACANVTHRRETPIRE